MIIANILARALGDQLAANYAEIFGQVKPEYTDLLRTGARVVVERIANTDALYHDVDHTMLVTQVGQAILRGRLLAERTTAEDWVHFTVATLVHDIGYLRGICDGDVGGRFVINEAGETITLPRGASDAALGPYHVDRGKLFVRQRLGSSPYVDAERIARAIELTRFPVPADDDHAGTADEPGLVRAADLIGQLGDPHYPNKWNALFHEFVEIGLAERLGYVTPADLADDYPRFFWTCVSPYLGHAIEHLDRTEEGKGWLAHLYSHVFVEEHVKRRFGPERSHNGDAAVDSRKRSG
ncbi:MAG: metal-dependent phosphohydrolase [Pseudomonadota bacterium]